MLYAAKHPEPHRFMLQEGTDSGERLVWMVDPHVPPLYRVVVYALIGAAPLPYAVAPEYQLLTRAMPDSPRRVEDLL